MGKYFLILAIFLPVITLISPESYAQLCQGSLGNPVVNITFGAETNPDPPVAASTSYIYSANNCPNDGYYTIEKSIGNCFGNSWASLAQDHTPGDNNGYMMVVNASYNPGDFFVKTVNGLCPNTTYEFAAWLYNLLLPNACKGQGIKPNITFSIETTSGAVLKTYSTGDIGESTGWIQYGFYFSTTVDINSVVLRMTNNAPGGCGNDLVLDDITFRPCGPLVSSIINSASDSVDVCTGDKTLFSMKANVSAGYSAPVYQWQVSRDNGNSFTNINGANETVYVRPPVYITGKYLYRIAVSEQQNINVSSCSIFSNVVSIGVNAHPVIDAGATGHCTDDTLYLTAKEGATFLWTGPMNFSSVDQNPFIPKAVVANEGTYYVTGVSDKGCASTDSVKVTLTTKPSVNAGKDTEICEGNFIKLQTTASKEGLAYRWTPPVGISDTSIPNPFASPPETILYQVMVSDKSCNAYDSILIRVNKRPVANAGPDEVIIKGQTATLNGAAGGTDVSYLWTPDNNITGATLLTPIVTPSVTQPYTLNVYSNRGCGSATDQMVVKVYKQLYIPNAFTPNGDGLNDVWDIEALRAYPGAEVKIYNRFGQIVFDNHGTNIMWDGKFRGEPLSPGVFVYLIDLKNKMPVIKGTVTLIL